MHNNILSECDKMAQHLKNIKEKVITIVYLNQLELEAFV